MYVIDLEGNEYPLQATTTNEKEVNGNQSLSTTILATKVNKKFISDIKEMWRIVDHDNVEHKIIYAKRKGIGRYKHEYEKINSSKSTFYYRPTQPVIHSTSENKLTSSTKLEVEIKAIPLFFDDFDNDRIYENINRHMTAINAFTKLFSDTDYDFVLVDQFDAVDWEGFGAGETRLETFKRCLERYKCEFRISGNIIYLEKQIGRDTQFQYRHRLNSTNIEEEIDAAEMWTYAKGYGDYGSEEGSDDDSPENSEDWENAKLIEEYTSPLAEIIGIRHAPPIKDGRVTKKSTMRDSLKKLVDDSLKISVSADVIDLQKQGYPVAQSEVGDRVFLIDERIGLDDEVRVISQSKTRNWKGDVIDLNITFGSEGITKRHQSNISNATKVINELLEGKRQLPFSVYDNAVKNATKTIKGITSELEVPSNGGLMAVDKNDPNNVVIFNAAGIGVSDDGGATFKNSITGNGVVAETVIGKSLIGLNMTSADESGYFHVNGSDAEFFDTNSNRRVSISPSGLYGYNSNNNIRFQADSSLVTSAAFGTSNSNVYLASSDGGEARVVRFTSLPGDGTAGDYTYRDMRSLSVKSPPGRNAYIGTDGELRVMSEGLSSTDVYRDVRMGRLYANTHEVRAGVNMYLRTDDRVRIMGTGESEAYKDLQTAHIQAQSIRKNTAMGGAHFYLGVNTGELRVSTNSLADGGYRPVRALRYLLPDGSNAFANGESSLMSMAPKNDEGLNLVNDMELLRYTNNDLPTYRLYSDNLSLDEVVANIVKSFQEISKKINEIEERLNET